jgi:hypothetical protein
MPSTRYAQCTSSACPVLSIKESQLVQHLCNSNYHPHCPTCGIHPADVLTNHQGTCVALIAVPDPLNGPPQALCAHSQESIYDEHVRDCVLPFLCSICRKGFRSPKSRGTHERKPHVTCPRCMLPCLRNRLSTHQRQECSASHRPRA